MREINAIIWFDWPYLALKPGASPAIQVYPPYYRVSRYGFISYLLSTLYPLLIFNSIIIQALAGDGAVVIEIVDTDLFDGKPLYVTVDVQIGTNLRNVLLNAFQRIEALGKSLNSTPVLDRYLPHAFFSSPFSDSPSPFFSHPSSPILLLLHPFLSPSPLSFMFILFLSVLFHLIPLEI